MGKQMRNVPKYGTELKQILGSFPRGVNERVTYYTEFDDMNIYQRREKANGDIIGDYSEDKHSWGRGKGEHYTVPTEYRLKYKDTAIARDIANVRKKRG